MCQPSPELVLSLNGGVLVGVGQRGLAKRLVAVVHDGDALVLRSQGLGQNLHALCLCCVWAKVACGASELRANSVSGKQPLHQS